MRGTLLTMPTGCRVLDWLEARQADKPTMFPEWPDSDRQLALVAAVCEGDGHPVEAIWIRNEQEMLAAAPEYGANALWYSVPQREVDGLQTQRGGS